jgi:hypothetical protein
MATDPHTATALIWRALVAALMPFRLCDARHLIGDIVRRVRAYDPNVCVHAPRILDGFRARFADGWRDAA